MTWESVLQLVEDIPDKVTHYVHEQRDPVLTQSLSKYTRFTG